MSYKGACKEFLESCGVSIGDIILIKKKDIEYQGMLLNQIEGVR